MQVSIWGQMAKQNVCTYNRLEFSLKIEGSSHILQHGWTYKHYAKCNTSVTEGLILYDSIVKYPAERQKIEWWLPGAREREEWVF